MLSNRGISELIDEARHAISRAQWDIGRVANELSRHRGVYDEDFAQIIGISLAQLHNRRAVFVKYADARSNWPNLHWHHFYAAMSISHADECLSWANDMRATVAEMKAWHRANYRTEGDTL